MLEVVVVDFTPRRAVAAQVVLAVGEQVTLCQLRDIQMLLEPTEA
jgi:hypothetical protein